MKCNFAGEVFIQVHQILSVINAVRALEIAALSSGKGLILIIVSSLKKLSLEWGMLCSRTMFLTSEDQLSSILEIVLAPQNTPSLTWYAEIRSICQWGKRGINTTVWETLLLCARMIPNVVLGALVRGNSLQTAKTLLCLLPLNCFCQLSPSTGSDIGDNSNMSPVPSLTWPPALSTKVLYRATQSH